MSLLEKALKKIEESKVHPDELFTPVEKVVSISDLKPPQSPKKEESQNEISDYVNRVISDQSVSSDEKRHRYYVITDKTWRGTNQGLDSALYQHYKEIEEFRDFKKEIPNIVKTITEEYKRGNSKDKKALIGELKESLAKRKTKLEDLT